MNERIRELAEQALQLVADEHANGDESRLNLASYTVKDLIQEKFAELIVRECVESMQVNLITETQPVPGTMDYIQNHTINLCANTVKKHFGVEDV
jgi:hypothetical protein